jgi:hypothetical protein
MMNVATPLWGKCKDETHTHKSGNLESSGTPKNAKLDCRGQNTSHWCVLYTVGKVLKCRCRKWPCMSHLGHLQHKLWSKEGPIIKSRSLKVKNWPNPDMYRWSATHRWKDLKESYKFALDLISIRGLSWELWALKVLGIQIRTISKLLLRSLGTKSHSNVGAMGKRREYYVGEGGGFPWV